MRREKRANRMATLIVGLESDASDLPALLKRFRIALGVGGTIKNGALEFHGDRPDKLVEQLRPLGYPAKPAAGQAQNARGLQGRAVNAPPARTGR